MLASAAVRHGVRGARATQRGVVAAAGGSEKLTIFDTTLRDGEQSPGATMQATEKLAIAKQLSRMGVDVCEAGFPIASTGDFEAVQQIAKEVGSFVENRDSGVPMRIAGLSRATEGDIDRCYDAVRHADLSRVHTFLATSDLHLEHKLKITRSEALEQVSSMVRHAKSLGGSNPNHDVEFSAEDAGRSDLDYLAEVFAVAIEAGATTLNVPDTVGFMTPAESEHMFKYLIDKCGMTDPSGDEIIWSTHCHNDLGLATANTLAGISGGARQVEVTINGIGERAGNTAIEEIVMSLHTRPQLFDVQCSHIDATQIMRASQMVSSYTGMVVQPNKAITGANAFAHEAGIHQDGVLKNPLTYEIMTPESVGLTKSSLVLGKHSGRAAFLERVQDLGYGDMKRDELNALFGRFKDLCDQKTSVTDADIEALLDDSASGNAALFAWDLESVHITGGDTISPSATVQLRNLKTGECQTDAAAGVGSVDAMFKAINRIVGIEYVLDTFTVQAVTDSSESLGRVTVRISPAESSEVQTLNPQSGKKDQAFSGHGTHTDILVATARAFVNSVNKLIVAGDKTK